jgi:hypothetical protein
MASWAEEAESAEELASEQVKKLQELDPEHELLKFFIACPEDYTNGALDPEKEKTIQIEMKNRFWDANRGPWQQQPGAIVVTVVMSNYYLAVKKAVEGLQAARVSV